MDLPEEAKRAPSAPVWNQSFPSPRQYRVQFMATLHGAWVGVKSYSNVTLNRNVLRQDLKTVRDSLLTTILGTELKTSDAEKPKLWAKSVLTNGLKNSNV